MMYMYDDYLIAKIVEDKYGNNHPLDILAPDYETLKSKLKACQEFIDNIKFYNATSKNKAWNCGVIDGITYMITNFNDREILNKICEHYSIVYDYNIVTGSIAIKRK